MKFCPNCGTKIENLKECPNCGFKPEDITKPEEKKNKNTKPAKKVYDYYENRSDDADNYDSYDYMKAETEVDMETEPSLASKILLILMVILFNIPGAVIGAVVSDIFMGKKGEGYKSYGKKLLIVSIVVIVIDIIAIWFALMAFKSMF